MNTSFSRHLSLHCALVFFLLFLPASFFPASARGGIGSLWYVEAEKDGYVTWNSDSVADIHAPGGLTLWYKSLMKGDVTIEYEARIVSDGRISDLNCFWMASDPTARNVFTKAKQRGGKFINTYTMQLYYVGYGGNHNSTTRFRRYNGDARGVTDAAFRPAILREYKDKKHLLKGDHWYKVRLEARNGRARFIIDGECLVDFADPAPLREGYFGFRTTLAHAQLRNFRYSCESSDNSITLHDVWNKNADRGMVYNNRNIPTTFGVPFSKGELHANELLDVICSGSKIPSDQWTLASWPDGSVKWKAIATVVPHNEDNITIKNNSNKKKKASNKHKVRHNNANVVSDSGVTLHPSSGGSAIFDSVTIGNTCVMGRVWVECNNNIMPVKSIKKEQAGNVRDCWLAEGENFSMRLYTYKGSNEMKIVHTAFIDSITNANGLNSLSLRFEVPLHDATYNRRVLFLTDSTNVQTMDVKPLISRRPIHLDSNGAPSDQNSRNLVAKIAAWDGFRLSQLSPNAFSIRKRATDQSPWIGTIEGHRAPGMVAVGDRNNSVAFHLTDFWQSYPSTLQVDKARSDKAVVSLHLWSPEAEAMSFTHYDTIPHGLDAAYEDIQKGMSTAYGIARTTTIYLNMTNTAIDSLKSVLPSLIQHPQYVPTPEYLHQQRAFGMWSLDRGTSLDTLLYRITEHYIHQQEEHSWYGFFNYGDVMHTYDPSRGEWRYDVGGYAWDNTELATPAMLWYEFLRTGHASIWRMAVAMSRHNAEVDCYHRGPHAGLGTRHNVLHWGCGAKEARISQAFWNRFLYYLTADERMGDLMHEVADADQLLYSLDPMRLAQPRSDKYPCTAPARLRVGPDWLAYAGNWFTEWERTGDMRYYNKIVTGMKSIAALPHGLFSGPKALGYDPATGIVSWEGDTAVQNTNHLMTIMGGFEMMNEMMTSVNTPEWSKAWTQHAKEYKTKALNISNNNFRIPRLMTYAYWMTGEKKYLNTARKDLHITFPIRFTNDAAMFTLDAIFMQEIYRGQ